MKLDKLLKNLEYELLQGDLSIDITGIAYDSRKVKAGYVFICIDGTLSDGHDYINSALDNGAISIIVEKNIKRNNDMKINKDIAIVKVKSGRLALAGISTLFYNNPSKRLNLIGITGTKGKTTITYMLKSILEQENKKVGLIGTVSNLIGDEVLYSARTTPEASDLKALLTEMLEKKVDYVIMEVSSQGLKFDRVSFTDFKIAVFTNISRAHIGGFEHPDFEDYLKSKIKLFKMCKLGIINIDSNYADEIIKNATCKIDTFGIKNKADFQALDIKLKNENVTFKAISSNAKLNIELNIPGMFSVYNALAAISTASKLNISKEAIIKGLRKVKVPGRVEKVNINKDYNIIIDYAHTPDSLKNILIAMNEIKKGRLICLFGCGGDRDNKMRPMMGEIAGKLCDFTIITSDNPRTEKPEKIIDEIIIGMKRTKGDFIKIINRYDAIKYAIEHAKAKDIIILAGKGHETYQIFKDKTIHFDEREVVLEIIDNK